MTAKLIDGKKLAHSTQQTLKIKVQERHRQGLRSPGLAVILVGDDPASAVYVKNKRLACRQVGILSFNHHLSVATTEAELLELIDYLNNDQNIDGILVQLPLPTHFDTQKVIERIIPNKDVDGFSAHHIGSLALRKATIRPCTPKGIMMLLDSIDTQYKGMEAVVVGASNHVGRPMALELLLAGATVTITHRFTANLRAHVERADILVVAAGKQALVKGEWIKPGATVVDVGIHRLESGTLTGDVEFESARTRAAWITPVPGGVGPMTVAALLENTFYAAEYLQMH